MSGFSIVQDYNGLAIHIDVHAGDHSPEAELLREFLRQHKNSQLVIVPSGGYHGGTINPGVRIDWYVIRRRWEPPSLWKRIKQFYGLR